MFTFALSDLYYYIEGMNRYQYGHAAAWTSAFDASGVPMTVTFNGTTYFYATNLQGDVVAILDSNGAAVVEYTYDAWGNLYSISGSLAVSLGLYNPLHYRGYIFDIETGLYYLQSRYYDPEMGRFINADKFVSTGQGLLGKNMFAYCLNNPINHLDSEGDSAVAALIKIGVGTLASGVANFVCTFATTGSLEEAFVAFGIGLLQGFIIELVEPFKYIMMALNSIEVFLECRENGVSIEMSLLCAVSSAAVGFALDNSIISSKAFDFTIATGANLIVEAGIEAASRTSSNYETSTTTTTNTGAPSSTATTSRCNTHTLLRRSNGHADFFTMYLAA